MAGQFPVRMHFSSLDGAGYPVSIFYGDILLYIPAVMTVSYTHLDVYKRQVCGRGPGARSGYHCLVSDRLLFQRRAGGALQL